MGLVFKSSFILMICACFLGCSSFQTSDSEMANLYLKMGTSQLQEGAYPQALTSLLKAESLDSSNPVIQNNLALVYLVRERYELAEKHLRNALRLRPEYSDARNNLGRVLVEMGRDQEAIKELTIVTNDLAYENPEKPLTNIGIAYFDLKHFDEARNYFNKALSIQRENCTAQSYLGRSLFELNLYDRASEALDRAVGFCQKVQFDEPHYYSALSYLKSGDKDRAEARLQEIIRLYPNGKYVDRAKSALETIRK